MQKLLYHEKYLCLENSPWVVFIHGAGGNSNIWKKQVDDFKTFFNVLLIDLRGHGESRDIPRKDETAKYDYYEICEEVLEVLDSLNIKEANFVGVSIGTIINRCIVHKYPERVTALVQSGAITKFGWYSRILSKTGDILKEFIPGYFLYVIFSYVAMPRANHRKARSLFIREAAKISQPEFKRWARLISSLPALMKYFDNEFYETPTLYLCGSQDYLFIESIKRTVAKHTNATFKIIENAGHVCNIEQPRIFNDYAMDFFKKADKKN